MPTLLNFLYEFKTDKHVTQYQECPRSPNRKRILARNHSKIRPPSQKMGSFQIKKKRIFLNTDRATTQGQQFIPCGMHVCMYVIKVWAQTAAPILPLFPVCCVWILVVIHTRAQERARSINRTLFIIHMKKKKAFSKQFREPSATSINSFCPPRTMARRTNVFRTRCVA